MLSRANRKSKQDSKVVEELLIRKAEASEAIAAEVKTLTAETTAYHKALAKAYDFEEEEDEDKST